MIPRARLSAVFGIVLVAASGASLRAWTAPQLPDGLTDRRLDALVSDRRAIDFGCVAAESVQETTVVLTNHRADAVDLRVMDADCTCLTSAVVPVLLRPGQSGDWRIRLHTCDYVGEVRKHVWIRAAGSPEPLIRLPVRYRVVPELYQVPDVVPLGLIGDDVVETRFEIRTTSRSPVRLLAAACDEPAVEVDLQAAEASVERPARVRVRVHGPLTDGPLQPTLWIDTSSPALPRLRVPLVGEAISGVRCDRPAVAFEHVPLGEAGTRTLTLKHDPDVRIGEIRSNSDAVDVVAAERGAGELTVMLRSSSRLPLGGFRGFLNVEVRRETARWIRIMCFGDVVEPESRAIERRTPAQATR